MKMTAKNGFTEYASETVIGEVEKRKRVLFCSVTSGISLYLLKRKNNGSY